MDKLLKRYNVLYVDDDTKDCESLEAILKYYFKNVFIANDGREALNIYKNNKCDLLIVDYDMPKMDGYELLSTIRQKDQKTQAIIVSAHDDKIKLKNAIKLNLIDYLVKPYELQELKDVLKKFIEKKSPKDLPKISIRDNYYYCKNKKSIYNDKEVYKLTAFEIKIFEELLENRKKIISYEKLLFELDSTNHKSLISIIHKLKKKLPPKIIQNIKDIGYILT